MPPEQPNSMNSHLTSPVQSGDLPPAPAKSEAPAALTPVMQQGSASMALCGCDSYTEYGTGVHYERKCAAHAAPTAQASPATDEGVCHCPCCRDGVEAPHEYHLERRTMYAGSADDLINKMEYAVLSRANGQAGSAERLFAAKQAIRVALSQSPPAKLPTEAAKQVPDGVEVTDASQLKQPGWNHVQQAFIDGAREARANPDATDADFGRASDGYTKSVFAAVDPAGDRYLNGSAAVGCVPGRRFTGVGELERTGYIPAGSAAERERTDGVSTPDGTQKHAKQGGLAVQQEQPK